MNSINLIGNVTRDPEVKATQAGKVFATFTIAVPRKYKREETDFINCVAWDKTAELISLYVKKGSKVAIGGRLEIDKIQDNAGQNKYFTKVVVEEVEFLTKKETSDEIDFSKLQADDFSIDVEE